MALRGRCPPVRAPQVRWEGQRGTQGTAPPGHSPHAAAPTPREWARAVLGGHPPHPPRVTPVAARGEHDPPAPNFGAPPCAPLTQLQRLCVPQLYFRGHPGLCAPAWPECPQPPFLPPLSPHGPASPRVWGGRTPQSPLHHGFAGLLPPPNPARPFWLGGGSPLPSSPPMAAGG